MRQSLCVSEGLALANALIEGTEWEKKSPNWKNQEQGRQALDALKDCKKLSAGVVFK
eukprot:CAMPEP_0172436670 /NCGR_PEP_ID=MMETSP1064-20121228/71847_1 /TAXON_ID=202472 /ORGANISM="Aulacoseira subarctica , Strain CCAP 1002/5" /LENGTH=56 /DNA_ID=CAMNT_0013185089 /DNA_START=683 /DNA_END=850 /DNA_ORIENTATION=+